MDFITQFPQFEDVAEELTSAQLVRSNRLLFEEVWGEDYWTAVSLDAAHCLTLRNLAVTGGTQGAFQGAMGPISSVSAAGISTSFGTLSAQGKSFSADWYSKTVYGQELLRLRSLLPITDLSA